MIVELRQQTLLPGRRDVLVDLFDRELVESQEALGMRIPGTFRDLEREDRVAWPRAFADRRARFDGLTATCCRISTRGWVCSRPTPR